MPSVASSRMAAQVNCLLTEAMRNVVVRTNRHAQLNAGHAGALVHDEFLAEHNANGDAGPVGTPPWSEKAIDTAAEQKVVEIGHAVCVRILKWFRSISCNSKVRCNRRPTLKGSSGPAPAGRQPFRGDRATVLLRRRARRRHRQPSRCRQYPAKHGKGSYDPLRAARGFPDDRQFCNGTEIGPIPLAQLQSRVASPERCDQNRAEAATLGCR